MSEPAAAAAAVPVARGRLTSTPFLLFWAAQTVTVAAEMFSYVALGWVTLQLTGSGAAVGAVLAVQAVPRAILMLAGGALSDRFTPVGVMTASAAARALVLGAFAVLVLTGRAQLGAVLAVAAALGVIGAFFYPARSSALPSVVDSDLLEPANAWIFVSSQAAVVFGPAVAGLVVARLGSGAAFAIDAAGFGLAVAGLLTLHAGRTRSPRRPASGLLAQVLDGLRYMWDDPMRRALLAVVVVLNFAVNGPFEVGVTVLARQRWGGPLALGTVIGAFGLGSVLGAILVGKLRGRLPLGWALVAVSAAFGLGFPVLGLLPSAWPAAVVTAVIGMFNACAQVLGVSWLQRNTPGELIGRVMSVVLTGAMAVAPLSYAIAGALIGLGIELPFALGGAFCLAAGAYCLLNPTARAAR